VVEVMEEALELAECRPAFLWEHRRDLAVDRFYLRCGLELADAGVIGSLLDGKAWVAGV